MEGRDFNLALRLDAVTGLSPALLMTEPKTGGLLPKGHLGCIPR